MSPRAVAPEKDGGLAAMRELANFSAHAAISHHAQRMLSRSAVGKLMLALSGDEECRAYAARTNLPAYTRNTINSLPKLLQEAARLRQQGYAFDDEEAEIGVGCIGTLIYDASDNIVAGLSVSAPIERRKMEWVEKVLQAAGEISEQLGYRSTIPN